MVLIKGALDCRKLSIYESIKDKVMIILMYFYADSWNLKSYDIVSIRD